MHIQLIILHLPIILININLHHISINYQIKFNSCRTTTIPTILGTTLS